MCLKSEWTHKEDERYPGSMDFDVEYNIKLITRLIKETLRKSKVEPKNIVAVSTTSMREAIVLYDEEGKELWACANVDSRSNHEVSHLHRISPTLEPSCTPFQAKPFH